MQHPRPMLQVALAFAVTAQASVQLGANSSQDEYQSLRGLFPGPLHFGAAEHPAPFPDPDPLVLDMFSSLSNTIQELVMPKMHKASSVSNAPDACRADLEKHCPNARSQVHCLGEHRAEISEPCRKDVGASVPFVCSKAIGEFCDVLRSGMLGCLQKHLPQLPRDCRDAVEMTSSALGRLSQAPKNSKDPLLAAHSPDMVNQLRAAEKQAEDKFQKDMNQVATLLSKMEVDVQKNSRKLPSVAGWVQQRVALVIIMVMIYWLLRTESVQKASGMWKLSEDGTPLLEKGKELPKFTDEDFL
mmetsp:Transcript_79051/g.189907  ORF Transcript_79051/g.189907 Transcript_79051/m.189907 type:complete len:300 (-) Transcript_79051:69-968(-)